MPVNDQPPPHVVVVDRGQPAPLPEREVDRVPARVQVALAFLRDLTQKTSVHMAGELSQHDGYVEASGQQLSKEETGARNVALKTVEFWLAGALKPTEQETAALEQRTRDRADDGIEINCPNCSPAKGDPNCPPHLCFVCRGRRRVLLSLLRQ
jgi:hypothetical protein